MNTSNSVNKYINDCYNAIDNEDIEKLEYIINYQTNKKELNKLCLARVFNKNNVIFYKESTEQNYYLEKDNKGDLKCLSDITSEEVIEVIEKEIRNERGNEFEDSILYK